MLGKRLQRLIELPAQADDVPTCAQGDPVEVDSGCEAPFLLIHAGRPLPRLLARECRGKTPVTLAIKEGLAMTSTDERRDDGGGG